ncbi:EAL domain-containing protein [Frankia sp. AiPa1]|nr:EAL domain-containing protein [Frankia sp. AiPa1]
MGGTAVTADPGVPIELPQATSIIADLLDILRRQLDMDLALLVRAEREHLVVQVMRGSPAHFPLAEGDLLARRTGLLGQILGGHLPGIVADTSTDPRCAALRTAPAGGDRPQSAGGDEPGGLDVRLVRAYACSPVLDSDGEVYGLLVCLARRTRLSISATRDGRFLRLMAAFLTDSVLDPQEMWTRRRRVWQEVSDLIDNGGPRLVLQPIMRLEDDRVVGLEALSRFPDLSAPPQHWYANAATVGLASELERIVIRSAVALLPMLPEQLTLTVNVSPSTLVSGLLDLLPTQASGRLVMEITEHEHISDDGRLLLAVDMLRHRGIRIAIDDLGTGYAGLAQLLRLRPEIIKLDGVITRGIDCDAARRAIAAGLVEVAAAIGGRVVAEGIETPRELATVRAVGIPYGQGFLLGRPKPCADAARLFRAAASTVSPA